MDVEKNKDVSEIGTTFSVPWNILRTKFFLDSGASKKRLDIQGLRAFAIGLVYCFHFLPDTFPNGYLGVDMFFVLSGYLMALVLSREKSIGIRNSLEFYYRRAKRIMPCYYLVVLLSLVTMLFVMSYPWLVENSVKGRDAILFITNFENMEGRLGYAFPGKAQRHTVLFMHTWSLCVEMQFYIIVPLIFFLLKNVFRNNKYLCMPVLSVCLVASWYFNWSLSSDSIRQFNDPTARIWQFLFGILAFYLSLARESGKRTLESPHRLLVAFFLQLVVVGGVLCGLSFTQFNEFIARSIATILTAASLVIGSHNQSILLCNPPLTYIGDASYALYLTHWPIIWIMKYYAVWHELTDGVVEFFLDYEKTFATDNFLQSESPEMLLVAFVLSVLSAILLHHLFEKRHLVWGKTANILCTIGLFVAALALALASLQIGQAMMGANKEVINANLDNLSSVFRKLEAETVSFNGYGGTEDPFGLTTFPPGNGTTTVLITGNSYAPQILRIVQQILAGRYKNLYLFSLIGNQVVNTENDANLGATNLALVKQLRPDIVIVASRVAAWQKWPLRGWRDRFIVKGVERMNQMSEFCNHILIVGPHPLFPYDFHNWFIDRLQRNLPLEPANLNKTEADLEMRSAWVKYNAIVRGCKKCEMVNTALTMADPKHNQYSMFDPITKLAYADNTIHYTVRGLEKIRGAFKHFEKLIRDAERRNTTTTQRPKKRKTKGNKAKTTTHP